MAKAIFYAVVFLATGGVLFAEQFKKNRLMVGLLALIALVSFVLLVRELSPWLPGHGGILNEAPRA